MVHNRIGFIVEQPDGDLAQTQYAVEPETTAPKKCVARVYFAGRNMTLAYYNDRFDLHAGDMVYVDGQMEGQLGRIVDVNYNFKIRVSDYKRVIAVVDTDVQGQFFMAGSHFVTFDAAALPANRAVLWFKAPAKAEDEFVSGNDGTAFRLDDLKSMQITAPVAERGNVYYAENRVRYLSVDGTRGYAVVEGSSAYEVEFAFADGEISRLVCSCFCGYNCKHALAAMLQLKETLTIIEKQYAAEYEQTGYFAAVHKGTLFQFAIDGKDTGRFVLQG